MRFLVTAAAAATLIAATAFAQNYGGAVQPATPNASTTTTDTAPAADTGTTVKNGPSNPAIKTSEGNNPGAPVSGANSFTQGQAKARIESRGYANVTSLAKDNNGLWRGTAIKDGKSINVTLDYQGNVTVN
jgi:hypothetical protein